MSDAAEVLIGDAMAGVRARLRALAHGTTPVLIIGERGSGKKLVARTLHAVSERASAPSIAINCEVCTESIFETELFGRETCNCWGSSPRTTARHGRLDRAAGGTLFLWHVSELLQSSQARLARLLEERAFHRIGGRELIKADVRVVATASYPLAELVKAGEFFQVLAELLGAEQIVVPPLRERMDDFGALVQSFLAQHGASITPAALAHLATMTWHGNVADVEDFLAPLVACAPEGTELDEVTVKTAPPLGPQKDSSRLQRIVEDRAMAEGALQQSGGDHAAAAAVLGISPRRLNYLLRGPVQFMH